MEEDAVRKALGLPPTGSEDAEEGHISRRRRFGPSQVNNQSRREDGASGFGGADGGRKEEGGGQSERRCSQVNQAPGRAPLCLLLSNLGELFRWDVAAAADICADAFPGVRPW